MSEYKYKSLILGSTYFTLKNELALLQKKYDELFDYFNNKDCDEMARFLAKDDKLGEV